MIDFDTIKENSTEFAHENPIRAAVIALVVFLFMAGIVILLIQTAPEKKARAPQQQEHFTETFPLLIPESPDIEKEYYYSRTTENQWDKTETNSWFTFPDEELIHKTELENDRIIKDITGAAP